MKKYIILLSCLLSVMTIKSQQLTHMCGMELPTDVDAISKALCNNTYTPFVINHTDDLIPTGATRHLKIKTNVIFVQNAQGEGNFDINNPVHMDFWNRVFVDMNNRLLNLEVDACGCTVAPTTYGSVNIQYVPNFIAIKDNALFDHNQDPTASSCPGSPGCNSENKPYLNAINALAEATPGYEDGFNWIVTSDGPDYDVLTNHIQNDLNDDGVLNNPQWHWTRHYKGYYYSGFPTYNLDHPAMWHSPDLYLEYIVNVAYNWNGAIERIFVPFVAGAGLHEYGHYFRLGHSPCSSNIMRQGGVGVVRTSFNACQIRTMYETMMTRNLRKYVVCEDVIDHHITIDNDETWTNNVKVYNDIVIVDGGALNIMCELHLQPNTRIYVERGGSLTVDGGLITSCGEWNGILVEGVAGDNNNETGMAGKVFLKNGAIVENAKIAIEMGRNPSLGNTPDYWGGYVSAENSTIRNCRRGAAFMKHAVNATSLTEDRSYFFDVTFANIRDSGVTIWANDGIDFTDCTFIDNGYGPNDHEGILAWSAAINASTNEFIGCEVGITLKSPNQAVFNASSILTNTFRCEEEGVAILDALVFDKQEVNDNKFTGGRTGIYIDGPSQFELISNTFDGQNEEGIYITEGGNSRNIIDDNEFNNNIRGLCFNDDNNLATFKRNCFNGSLTSDIEVVDGDVFNEQGDIAFEAGNLFTKVGVPEILNQGTIIDYFVWDQHAPDARQRTGGSIGVTERDATLPEDASGCGSSLGLIPDDGCSFKLVAVDEILASIDELDNLLSQSNNGVNVNFAESLLDQRFLDLNNAVLGKGSFLNSSYNKSFLVNYLKQRNEFLPKVLVQSILLEGGDYGQARQHLNSISSANSDLSDFKAIQSTMIDYFEFGKESVDVAEQSSLRLIANKYGAMGSKARAIIHTVTGERIRLPKKYADQEVIGRSRTDVTETLINCYPNPSRSGSELIISTISTEDIELNYTIYSMEGILLSKDRLELNASKTVSTTGFSSGLYLLNVSNSEGKLIHVQTLTILD